MAYWDCCYNSCYTSCCTPCYNYCCDPCATSCYNPCSSCCYVIKAGTFTKSNGTITVKASDDCWSGKLTFNNGDSGTGSGSLCKCTYTNSYITLTVTQNGSSQTVIFRLNGKSSQTRQVTLSSVNYTLTLVKCGTCRYKLNITDA